MADTAIDPVTVDMVKDFLISLGQRSMMECLGIRIPRYAHLAKVCDRIIYDGLVEGRIEKIGLEIVRSMLKETEQQMSAQQWGRKFVTKLFNITHK